MMTPKICYKLVGRRRNIESISFIFFKKEIKRFIQKILFPNNPLVNEIQYQKYLRLSCQFHLSVIVSDLFCCSFSFLFILHSRQHSTAVSHFFYLCIQTPAGCDTWPIATCKTQLAEFLKLKMQYIEFYFHHERFHCV